MVIERRSAARLLRIARGPPQAMQPPADSSSGSSSSSKMVEKSKALFGALAARMDGEPDLNVRLCVNVHRKYGDDTPDAVLLRGFLDDFRNDVWPGERMPDVFYDPRSLATEGKARACLHAKCIVIDEDRALITSANFTEAAHERNIEAGTVISDTMLARALKAQFDTLMDHGALLRVPAGASTGHSEPSPQAGV
jgi:phosphatidylserine/phosphatidylglycerophosphate/cardiolipin synthase-like enzyme